MKFNPFRAYIRLIKSFDNYGITGLYRVVRKTDDDQWVTASKKAQFFVALYVQGSIAAAAVLWYNIGKRNGMEAQVDKRDARAYHNGYATGWDDRDYAATQHQLPKLGDTSADGTHTFDGSNWSPN